MKKSVFLLAAIIATMIQGCVLFGGKPNTEADIRVIEKQLETTSAEIGKIYASIQQTLEILMRHEAIIRELEATIEKEKSFPTDPESDEDTDSGISREVRESPPFIEELAAVTEPDKRVIPQDPKTTYDHALELFQNGNFHEAIQLFDSFVARFPDHGLADNALYWKGECFYTLRMYEESIRIFEKVAAEYATGNKAPDSYLKIGLARLSLNDRDAARKYLEKVVGEYPGTPAAAKAAKKLAKVSAET